MKNTGRSVLKTESGIVVEYVIDDLGFQIFGEYTDSEYREIIPIVASLEVEYRSS
tara:strand:+ start:238 stop:402 length:165 start_codon:yes stop_codon:yes gene_type:complete